ncbi:NUDIX hydrolase [Streptomyces sp. H27-D2]|uniref:NUDIX hydrolase n=1 Tax=Streptomyces sp. H27-D2 TaxID=3046304 RepID=UPI002DB7548B|nr:NUDIX domain-containing protein [Streptomyces sp. H27-D2]MEC4019686.1 NUDIX domain-containing protein [Streptomyces sp. H27-D2]
MPRGGARYLHHTTITDLPAGLVDVGEMPVDAVCRELAEETGLRAAFGCSFHFTRQTACLRCPDSCCGRTSRAASMPEI